MSDAFIVYAIHGDGTKSAVTAYSKIELCEKHIRSVPLPTRRLLNIKRFDIEHLKVIDHILDDE